MLGGKRIDAQILFHSIPHQRGVFPKLQAFAQKTAKIRVAMSEKGLAARVKVVETLGGLCVEHKLIIRLIVNNMQPTFLPFFGRIFRENTPWIPFRGSSIYSFPCWSLVRALSGSRGRVALRNRSWRVRLSLNREWMSWVFSVLLDISAAWRAARGGLGIWEFRSLDCGLRNDVSATQTEMSCGGQEVAVV